ncbi:MAG: hypothetical protein OEV49_11015, partial [candidate division Zixibacteria bacterium]|nr:hypothetical protein [candidate division Zixibacteria bacterium]
MKRNLWLFLLKLAVTTLTLGYFWTTGWKMAYPTWIDPIAQLFFRMFGVTQWPLTLTADHHASLIPFIGLLVATPGLITRWKRALVALVGGVAAIVLMHIVMSIAIFHIVDAFEMSQNAYRLLLPIYLVNDAMPLILWLAFFPSVLSELFGF